jgi:hypothetical protein
MVEAATTGHETTLCLLALTAGLQLRAASQVNKK